MFLEKFISTSVGNSTVSAGGAAFLAYMISMLAAASADNMAYLSCLLSVA